MNHTTKLLRAFLIGLSLMPLLTQVSKAAEIKTYGNWTFFAKENPMTDKIRMEAWAYQKGMGDGPTIPKLWLICSALRPPSQKNLLLPIIKNEIKAFMTINSIEKWRIDKGEVRNWKPPTIDERLQDQAVQKQIRAFVEGLTKGEKSVALSTGAGSLVVSFPLNGAAEALAPLLKHCAD